VSVERVRRKYGGIPVLTLLLVTALVQDLTDKATTLTSPDSRKMVKVIEKLSGGVFLP
jgi:hypothetical protein